MPPGRRRDGLDRWLQHELPQRFEGRMLPIDAVVADACGWIIARAAVAGRPIKAMDAFVAATTEVHDLTLVTRNVTDFEPVGISLLNPWTED
jgi:predicted nucleic acid-binding protein